MSKWDDPDPRIQWALDELDFGSTEPTTIIGYHYPVAVGTFIGATFWPLTNWIARRPLWAGLQVTAALTLGGFLGGRWYGNYRASRNAEEVAVMKHYIMTHPDKFPQPERKTFGDKVVFLPWRCRR